MTTTAEEPVTGEVVPYQPAASAIEEYRPRIMMTAAEAKEMDSQLRATMLAVLKENTDYGTIPGAGDRKNLLKPGAEKLLQWFGFGSRSAEVKIERDDPESPSGIADKARRIGVTYRTEVTKTISGHGEVVVATCEGYAGYDEDRYFATAEDARAKAEAKERANAARYKRPVNTSKWESITADYRAPWNTLIKMAQKRSYVGAAIDATGAAGLFTQDMEDVPGPTAVPAAMAAAARAAITVLPQAVGAELDAWYTALNWPAPDAWDAEQWCTALVKAGKLSEACSRPGARPAQDAPAAPPAANGNGPHVAPSVQEPTDEEWVIQAMARAAGFATPREGSDLWARVVARHEEGRVSDEDRAKISALMKARLEDIRKPQKPVEGVIVQGLDPEDEWAVKVADVISYDDAVAAAADVRRGMQSGHIAGDRGEKILAAIEVRVASLAGTGEAA